MQFIDQVKIYVKSGKGGDGGLSFRREKFIEFGGPDGGDGGKGGDVIARVIPGLNTLVDYRFQQHFKSQGGVPGMGKNRTGQSREDIYLDVPQGTQIFLEDNETLFADLIEIGDEVVLCKGGEGGRGNANFKSSTNQAPRKITKGELGEERTFYFQLKLLSDAGLVGLPNAGKSTFLAASTRAKPKIADYPFTTLHPQLGVVYVDEKEFVIADLPGLIEGAAEGIGLGHRFLGHVERCGIILHLIDVTQEDVVDAYKTIRSELTKYGGLDEKPEIIALNKCDAALDEEIAEKQAELEEYTKQKIYTISGISKKGVEEVLREMLKVIKGNEEEEE